MVDAAPHEAVSAAEVADVGVIGRSAGAHLAAVSGYGAVGGGVGGLGVLVLGVIVSLVLDQSALGAGTSALLVLYVAAPAVGLGMLFGTVTGLVGGVLSLPWRRRPQVLARFAWAWAAAMAGVAILLVAAWSDGIPATSPSPNETMQHVIEDWALGVVGPGLAAGLVAVWVARSLARPRVGR